MNAPVRWGALLIAAVAAGCAAPAPISAPGASGPLALDQVKGASWTRALTKVTWPNRDGHASVVFRDRLWVMGGWGTGPLNDVWSSTDALNWQLVIAEAPWPSRKAPTAVVFQDRIWLLGGSLGVETTHDVWSSADGHDWSEVTAEASWPKRHNHAAVVFVNKIWSWAVGATTPGGI